MSKEHNYKTSVIWTGNTGEGTKTYSGYSRAHKISVLGKPVIAGSSDPHFRGDKSRYNPEEMLVAALSACHMLSYLHMCASAGIVVVDYEDEATGTMAETENDGGHFTEVNLHPQVSINRESDPDKATELHHKAHELCFIANSVNFPVRVKPIVIIAEEEIARAKLKVA